MDVYMSMHNYVMSSISAKELAAHNPKPGRRREFILIYLRIILNCIHNQFDHERPPVIFSIENIQFL